MSIHSTRWRIGFRGALGALSAVLAVAAFIAVGAQATTAVAPQSSTAPTISGQPRDTRTLTANNGTWTNTPTSFSYQWQQCDTTGANCAPISSATAKTYKVASGNVDHTLRVAVTATNADGSTAATSQPSSVVSSNAAPNNTASPTISGNAKVGEQLTVDTGTWTGGVHSYAYQWQSCNAAGASCTAVQDATAKSYGVRTVDVGNTLRVVVSATNLAGTASATSAPTQAVSSGSAPVTAHNHAPTLTFVGLRRLGNRIYARFNLCDDGTKNVTVVEQDSMAGRVGYSRRFSIAPRPCGTHAKNWTLIPRFHHAGRFTVTIHAVDKSGASSRTVSRSVVFGAA